MADVAVVAHSRKSLGGGLPELRKILATEGVTDPLWYEVKKSRRAPKFARRAAAKGVDVLFVWGGDGTVQRCIDAVAGTDTAVAILPAGTANLLATNLKCRTTSPRRSDRAARRPPPPRHRLGERRAFHGDGGRGLRRPDDRRRRPGHEGPAWPRRLHRHRGQEPGRAPVRATVTVDGKRFFTGKVSCVLDRERRQDLRRDRGLPAGAARTTGSSSSGW